MILFEKKEQCYGCCSCANACPQNCIKIIQDEEGFYYPVIKDAALCTDCGVCQAVCPYRQEGYINTEKPDTYALHHKDKDVLLKSTSGGAFTAIAQAFCNHDFAIFGAAFGSDFTVVHKYITDFENMQALRKSKYVQSFIGSAYAEAKQFLTCGKKVLFSGTPCQIAGLKAFLKIEYTNLLTAEVICRGVPSPLVYKKYIEYLEVSNKGRIIQFDFRSKEHYGWRGSQIIAQFDNKKTYKKFALSHDDPYTASYFTDLNMRPSCYNCRFASLPRVADFTMGDLWGAEKIMPETDHRYGLSVLLANTQKAKSMIEKINEYVLMQKVDLPSVIDFNRRIQQPDVIQNPKREQFFKDIKAYPFSYIKAAYHKPRTILRQLASRILCRIRIRKNKKHIN